MICGSNNAVQIESVFFSEQINLNIFLDQISGVEPRYEIDIFYSIHDNKANLKKIQQLH